MGNRDRDRVLRPRRRQDYSSEVFFKTPPDAAGNICSPIATVFQSASFISSLEELALQAEVVRARQMLVTQPAQRQQGNPNLDPANLFFDSESRAVQASASADEDTAHAQSLAMTAKLMNMINRMQTTDPATGRERTGQGAVAGGTSHVPSAVPPYLFTCPDKQQVVPGVRPPEARGDLVELMRVVNDHSDDSTDSNSWPLTHPPRRVRGFARRPTRWGPRTRSGRRGRGGESAAAAPAARTRGSWRPTTSAPSPPPPAAAPRCCSWICALVVCARSRRKHGRAG